MERAFFLLRRRKVRLSAANGRRMSEFGKPQLTPFLGHLFPAQCSGGDGEGALDESVLAIQRALVFGAQKVPGSQKLSPPSASSSSSSFSPYMRSWHLIANLKSAEIHKTNGEAAARGTQDSGGVSKSFIHHDKDATYKVSPKVKGPVTPGEIVRLLRHSVGGMRPHKKSDNAPTIKSAPEDEHSGINFETILSRALCACDETVEDGDAEGLSGTLRLALDHTRQTSAYTFHFTFEALIRRGENELAIELFRRWWQHNPHLFPIEMELCDELEVSLRALRASSSGNKTTNERLAQFRRDVLAPRLAQMPHKKDFISSALFTRIILVAVRLGDTALVNQFVIKEILHEGVLDALCGGVILFSSSSSSIEIDETKLRFDPIREKFEDWLVLVGAIVAVALLERHAIALRRGLAAFDQTLRLVREDFMSFIRCACRLDDTKPAPAWSHLLFTTILRCHEESGVFHVSPARRPGNVAELWQCIHSRLLRQFPNVFHAGNAVTTLLTFAALEETAVSSLGTQHLSFVGKEEALCRWRLECVRGKTTGEDNSFTDNSCVWRNQLPRSSRRLRARFVAAHCTDSVVTPVPSLAATENEENEIELRSRGQYRKGFGTVQSFAVSQVSLPVFLTAKDVIHSTTDAFEALSATHFFALDIFRTHTAQMLLCPANGTPNQQSRGEFITAEALKPSLLLLVRLLSLLGVVGERVRESNETGRCGSGRDGEFALVDCITEDLLPYCRPSVASSLQKVIVSHLSRSGAAGVRALVTDYRKFLELMTESDALERLVFGLLWSGGSDGDSIGSGYSFGSGSAAWQVMAQNRQALRSSGTMLEMALSHLATLAIAIPDDQRRLMSIRQCVCRIVSHRETESGETGTCGEEGEVEVLHKELQWYPPASVHVYVSLLELLSWAVDETSENTDTHTDAYSDVHARAEEEGGRGTANMNNAVPSIAVTVRQWHTVWLRLYEMCTNTLVPGQPMTILSHAPLERACVILSHSCPDLDMLIASLLILLRPRRESTSLELQALPAVPTQGTASSFVTPRLLSSLSSLLVSNGVQKADIETWRQENGAPSPLFDGTSSLYQWHCACLGRCEKESSREDSTFFTSSEPVLFLGSVVLDVLISDPRWLALRRDNYYAAALAPVTEESAWPLGVVLPSRQMASSYPAGVRQRITNLRDAIREMSPEERWRLRGSFSSACASKASDVISTYSISDDDDDDGDDAVEDVSIHSEEKPR